jgi:hypothetical protein
MPLKWNNQNCVFRRSVTNHGCWFDKYSLQHFAYVPFFYAWTLYACYSYKKITTTRGALWLLSAFALFHLVDEICNNYTPYSFENLIWWDQGSDTDSLQNFLGDNICACAGLFVMFAIFYRFKHIAWVLPASASVLLGVCLLIFELL